MIFPVILSGGFGGRLWPLSRVKMPKQFIPLLSENSLFQEAVIRTRGIAGIQPPTLICNTKHRFIAAEQLRKMNVPPRQILLEPVGRNTAPAILVSALQIAQENPDGVMLVMPSDHLILDIPNFKKAVLDGQILSQQDYLVTFGIIPNQPKTGYGYIQQGEPIESVDVGYRVRQFVEKPNLPTAEKYLAAGDYFWNSGIFMFKASTVVKEFEQFAPAMVTAARNSLDKARQDKDFCWLDQPSFELSPSDSIDYALMEKTSRASVIPVSMGWSDVGSWGSLWEVVNKDAVGNVIDGNVFTKSVSNCYIKSEKEVVAALGISDLIVIETDDALLVAHRDNEQDVKEVFNKLM